MSVECLSLLSVRECGVVLCKGLVSVWFVDVFFVKTLNEFPEAGGVCAEIDVIECLFPSCCLFIFYVGVNFRVECVYACYCVRCGGEGAKMSAGLYFVFDLAAIGGVVVSDVARRDEVFVSV